MTNLTGQQVANIIKDLKLEIKSIENTKVVIMVDSNRVDAMMKLSERLSNIGAKYDQNAKGSSLGAVIVGKVRVFVKSKSRSSNGLGPETIAMNMLNDAIMGAVAANSGKGITIIMNKKDINNVIGVEKTNGTPKSDFHLINTSKQAVAWISHKKGKTFKDFQQWGGVTNKAFENNAVIQAFALGCKSRCVDNKMPNATTFWAKIPDTTDGIKLKKMTIYGINAPTGIYGVECCNVLVQGNPALKQIGKKYEIISDGPIHYFPELPHGGYDPVITLIYKGDRDQFGLKGARAGFWPAGGRNYKKSDEINI